MSMISRHIFTAHVLILRDDLMVECVCIIGVRLGFKPTHPCVRDCYECEIAGAMTYRQ